ncbi:hypothetical protein RSOLAG1IB_04465 [Rhizoctonia solani AG-1 IB]|uniref:Uncharacterized protein n=1 Tax=Thanatephorus cucumeris (strain AG1-IB / isolate 7/3/14) TaxID=1108050 RepID=A0A0B7FVK0_THACB|nr:hypothetical protein RSOLAG1IB_04465 [Rhizoctonia solani AG-1 IB]
MYIREDSPFASSDYDGGTVREPLPSTLEVSQESIEAPGSPIPQQNNQARANAAHVQCSTKPISSYAVMFQSMRSAWKVVQIILMTCLVSTVIPNTIVQSHLTTLCNFPILSKYYPHCVIPDEHITTPDFVTLAGLQSRMEYVMERTAGSSKAAVDIKDSEMALRDLGTLVKQSNIAGKDALGRDISHFINEAKIASGNLQRFGSHVWGAVDRILSLNERTLTMLESVSTGRGDIIAHRKGLELIWIQSIELMEKNLRRLIHEAQDNVGLLQRLEERLNNIQDMVYIEIDEISGKERELRRDLLGELFGTNQDKRRSHDASRELLEAVGLNRKVALRHVTDVLFKLEQMSNDLDGLRERVAQPLIVADSSNTSIEEHINSMRSETKRLESGQTRMREIEDEYRQMKFTSN